MNLLKIVTVCLLLWCGSAFSAPLKTINFEGLTQTKESFLHQLLTCEVGEEYDSLKVQADEQALKNLNLFFSVESEVNYNEVQNGHNVTFIIKEATYIYPLLSVSGFDDILKIQLGLSNINWEGRNQTIGFVYQYYGRHSLSFYQKTPRHKNGKTGHRVSISKYSSIEPLYFDNTTSEFNFDNYSLFLNGNYWLSTKWNLELGGGVMREVYEQVDAKTGLTFADFDFSENRSFNLLKYQMNSSIAFNNVNQHFEFFSGLKFKLYLENIITQSYDEASFKRINTFISYYKRVGEKGNFAANHTFGMATNNESPFSPFVLDGFLNIRGIGNRVIRGTAENIINLEYRHTVLDEKYVRMQLVGLTDVGALREPGGELSAIFDPDELNYYSGLGIRIHAKFIYKAIIRLDYSINLKDQTRRGLTFGFGQFF